MADVWYVCPRCGRRSRRAFPPWHFARSLHEPYCGTNPVRTAVAKESAGVEPAPRPILFTGLTKAERVTLFTVHPNGGDPVDPQH